MQDVQREPDRNHALDALRGFALLAGIVLHATMSFIPGLLAIPGLPAPEKSPSVTLAVAFFVIHVFRMATFFLIAGFFAHLMFHKQGLAGFVRDRAKRILVPLLAGWIVVGPLVVAAMWWGAVRAYGHLPANPQAGSPGLPLFHLWFLYVLILLYVAVICVRYCFIIPGADRSRRVRAAVDAGVHFLVKHDALALVLAVPSAIVLSLAPRLHTLAGMWAGVPTPDTGFVPNRPSLVVFGTAFAVGWLLHRQPGLLRTWAERWARHAAVAVAAMGVCLCITGLTPDLSNRAVQPFVTQLVCASCYGIAIWSSVFAIVGLAVRYASGYSATRRYLADSSYWLYLLHLPLVFFLQSAFAPLQLTWVIKFPLILALTLGVLLASYELLVRHSFLGALLNGRRVPRTARARVFPQLGPITSADE